MTVPTALGGRVLDVAALVDIATDRTIYGQSLIPMVQRQGLTLAIPAAALLVARGHLEPGGRGRLHLLPHMAATVVDVLDLEVAETAGDLLATVETPLDGSADATSATHVALSALRRGWPVITDRGATLRAVDATIEIDALP